MAIVTGRLGLEDLLWGEGTVTQDLGNGLSRTVSKINAKNLPFDETKTLAEAIDTALAVFNTTDIKYFIDNLPAVLQVAEVLAKIKAMDLSDIASVADALPMLQLVANNIHVINNAITASLEAKQAAADAKYLRCDIQNQLDIANMHAVRIEYIYNDKLIPLQDSINNLLEVAQGLVATARDQVIAGHELAVKFATYDLKLQVVPTCRTPSIRIDDTAKAVVWSIPRPMCAVAIDELPDTVVRDAVDSYLATLPNLGGGFDEPVTVDDLEPANTVSLDFSIAINENTLSYIDETKPVMMYDIDGVRNDIYLSDLTLVNVLDSDKYYSIHLELPNSVTQQRFYIGDDAPYYITDVTFDPLNEPDDAWDSVDFYVAVSNDYDKFVSFRLETP